MAWWHRNPLRNTPRTLPEDLDTRPSLKEWEEKQKNANLLQIAKNAFEAKKKQLQEELTQPENPYAIVKANWVQSEQRGGFYILAYKNYIYGRGGYSLSDSPLPMQIADYEKRTESLKIENSCDYLSDTLFPTFETAESWLKAYINGPEKVVYSKTGERVN